MAQAGSLFYKLIPELDHTALAKAASSAGTTAGTPMGQAMGKTASEHIAAGLAANGAAVGAAAGAPMGQAMGKVASEHMVAGIQASSTSLEAKAASLGTRVGSAIGKPLGAALSPIGTAIGFAEKQFDRLPPVIQRTVGSIPGHAAAAGRGLTSALGSSLTESTRQFQVWGQGLQKVVGAPVSALDRALSNFGVTGGAAVGLLGAAAVGTGIKFDAFKEQASMALGVMLEDTGKAQKLLSDLTTFALKTPFAMPGLIDATKKMIAFGFKAEDVIPTLQTVGDAMGGLGGGDVGLQRVIYALGQIKTRGKVMATEMLQLTNAGIPAWAILANKMGVTTGELQKMVTKGVVPADQAVKDLLDGIKSGTDGAAGHTVAFAGLMEAQFNTVTGTAQRLKESFTLTMGKLMEPAMPALQAGMARVIDILQGLPAFLETIKQKGQPLVDFIKGPLVQSARNVWDAFYPVLAPIVTLVGEGLKNAFEGLGGVLRTVGDALVTVTQWMKDHEGVMTVATYAVLGYVAAVTAMSIINGIVGLTYALATGIRAIGLAIMANPIGLIVGLLAALAAGLIYAYNHSEEFRRIVDNAWTWVKNAAVAAWEAMKTVFAAFGAALDWIIQAYHNFMIGAQTAWTAVKDAAAAAWTWLKVNVWDPFQAVLTAIGDAWTAFAQFATDAWNVVVEISKWAIAILMAVVLIPFQIAVNAIGVVFTELKNMAVDAWHTIVEEAQIWWDFLSNLFNTVITFLSDAFMPKWVAFRDLVVSIWTAISDTVSDWWNNKVLPIWNAVINFLGDAFTVAWTTFRDWVVGVFRDIGLAIEDWWNNKVLPLWNTVIDFLGNAFTRAWTTFRDFVVGVWSAIWSTLSDWWNNKVLPLWNTIINFLATTFTEKWNAFRDVVIGIWTSLQEKMSAVWNWVKANVFDPMVKFITEDIPEGFRKGVEWIGKLWDGIKAALREPLQIAIDVVWNNGIVKVWNEVAELVGIDARLQEKHLDTFAAGGVWKGGALPGHTPGRDVHRFYSPTGGGLALSGGESIMRPEFTDVLGRGRINELNQAARHGGVRGVARTIAAGEALRGFADGGAGLSFARGEQGKPYIWGGVGPTGYDCSGFIAAIANVIMGRPAHKRLFSTASFGPGQGAGGFAPGEGSDFVIGVTRNANNSGIGHMAGTLQGVNVESRGHVGVLTGSAARGAHDPLFPWRYFLPGVGGGAPPVQAPGGQRPVAPPPPPPPVLASVHDRASEKWQPVRDQVAKLPPAGVGSKWTEISAGFMRRVADELWKHVAAKADAADATNKAFGEVIAPGGQALADVVTQARDRAAEETARLAREAGWRAQAMKDYPTDPAQQEQMFGIYKRRWERDQGTWENLRRYTNDMAVQQKMFDNIKKNIEDDYGFWGQRTMGNYPLPEQSLAGQPAGVKLQMADLRRHFGPELVLYSGVRPQPPPGDTSHPDGAAVDLDARDDIFNYISANWPETAPPTFGRSPGLLRTQQGNRQIQWGVRQAPMTPWVRDSHTDHVHWTRDWDKQPPGFGMRETREGVGVRVPGSIGARDEGGWLPPGWSTIYNGTGREELVLNARQLAAIAQGSQGGGPLVGALTVQVPERASAREVVDELTFALRHSRRGGLHGRRR